MSQTRAQLVKGLSNTSASADAILVDSNGNVGINSTPEAWSGFDALEVNEASIVSSGSGDAFFTANAYYDGAWKYKDAGVARNIYMNSDGIVFRTAAAGSADGAITWTEGGRWREAGGLTFNGDTAAVNALDDYEEGTFTPAFKDSGYTYSQQHGRYTKIGNRVLFNIFLSWSANTASGNAVIDGFTHAVPNALQYYGAAAITNNGITLPSGTDTVVAQISPTGPEIAIYAADSGTSKVHVTNSQMGSSGEVIISGQYWVA